MHVLARRSRSTRRDGQPMRASTLPQPAPRDAAHRRHRPHLLPGARPAAASCSAASASCRCRRTDERAARRRGAACATTTMHGDAGARRLHCGWRARRAPARTPALVQVAETLDKRSRAGHRDHQGRDPAAVRDPAAGGAAGLAGAGARHRAAVASCSSASARARARRPEPDRRARRCREEVAPLVRVDQRPADAAGRLDRHAEALPRRRRAPAEDAAGRPAHAGRAGAARDRRRRAIRRR